MHSQWTLGCGQWHPTIGGTRTRTDEVDDEAAGGAVEEGLAVGRVRHGARRAGVADEVARVGQRVAEREEVAVPGGAAAAAACRRCQRGGRARGYASAFAMLRVWHWPQIKRDKQVCVAVCLPASGLILVICCSCHVLSSIFFK
jgi:hypothetical protein